jgi:hypothetical protein
MACILSQSDMIETDFGPALYQYCEAWFYGVEEAACQRNMYEGAEVMRLPDEGDELAIYCLVCGKAR